MAGGNLAPGFVSLPNNRRIAGLQPPFAGVHEGRVPAPGINSGDTHAARSEIERCLSSHSTPRREIFVGADAAARPGVDQHDIEWLQLVSDALEFRLDLR